APRHLHSFPTRRSSDLAEPDPQLAPTASSTTNRSSSHMFRFLGKKLALGATAALLAATVAAGTIAAHEGKVTEFDMLPSAGAKRSEEHTSELQSRENLV